MTEIEFDSQIERLRSAWPTSFPVEKVKLIWDKTKDLSNKFMRDSTEYFLANNKASPLPVDFIELARIERKSGYSNGGFPTRSSQIHPSENSIFSKEDIAEMFMMMRKRLNGEITYEELEQYGKVIQAAVDSRVP